MRDGEIVERFNSLTSGIIQDHTKLRTSHALVRTRIDALERFMLGSRFGIVRAIILQLISPPLLARTIQAYHAREIHDFNQEMAAANQRQPAVKRESSIILRAI